MNTYAYTREPEFTHTLREIALSGKRAIITGARRLTIYNRAYRNGIILSVTPDPVYPGVCYVYVPGKKRRVPKR